MKFHFINTEKLAASNFKANILDIENCLYSVIFPSTGTVDKLYGRSIINSQINVIFVSKTDIKELNNEWRGKDQETDVLSFNINEPELLGELYVSLDYVKENYSKYELSFDVEVVRLFVHGVLHLCGFDHTLEFSEASTEEMFKIQEQILNKIKKSLNL